AEGGATPAERIAWGYRTALGRAPAPDETKILTGLYDRQRAEFAKTPAAANKLLAAGEAPHPPKLNPIEAAAATAVARAILNLHETITRD
ncbi:MAG TPA: hypothetical protein VNC50_06165, partial [Planctomycetia bacterium]|nr:hypothetical protein [Planctomycetia bacterium]